MSVTTIPTRTYVQRQPNWFAAAVTSSPGSAPLTSGARLGPYEILSPLGAGGMGEVYRARDTKLQRDVAIKVLPSSVAGDPARLARLQV